MEVVAALDPLYLIAHISGSAIHATLRWICICVYRLSVVLKEETTCLHLTGRLCTTWGWFTSQQNSMHLLSITSQQPSTCILHLLELSCCLLVSLVLFAFLLVNDEWWGTWKEVVWPDLRNCHSSVRVEEFMMVNVIIPVFWEVVKWNAVQTLPDVCIFKLCNLRLTRF